MALTQKPLIITWAIKTNKLGLPVDQSMAVAPWNKVNPLGRVVPQAEKFTIKALWKNELVTPAKSWVMPTPAPAPTTAIWKPQVSVDDFATRLKEKYPQYANVDNHTLTERMLSVYPQYKDVVSRVSRTQSQMDATYKPTTILDQIKAGDYKGAAANVATKAGVWVAWAAQWIIDTPYNVRKRLWLTTQAEDVWYAQGKEKIFWDVRNTDQQAFGVWQELGKQATIMAVTPWFWPMRGAWILKKAIAWGIEGAWAAQISSLIDKGELASAKDTRNGAIFWSVLKPFTAIWQKGWSLKQTEKLIMPKLTPSVEAERAAMGLKKTWFLGKITMNATKQEKEAAVMAQKILRPNKTVVENIWLARKVLNKETDDLIRIVDQSNVKLDPKEIVKRMRSIEKPLLIRGGENEAKYDAAIKKFEEIMKKHPSTPWGLLKSRKEFDNWVEREIPNLYNSDTMTPLKVAITKIREVPNNWLNENVGWDIVKAGLKKQSQLINIVENLSTKSEQTGGNRLSRFVKRNPQKIGFLKGAAWLLWATLIWKKALNAAWYNQGSSE